MLTEQKHVGIRDKMPFDNFGGVLVIKYIKIPEISVIHKEIYQKISIYKPLELKTNTGNL